MSPEINCWLRIWLPWGSPTGQIKLLIIDRIEKVPRVVVRPPIHVTQVQIIHDNVLGCIREQLCEDVEPFVTIGPPLVVPVFILLTQRFVLRDATRPCRGESSLAARLGSSRYSAETKPVYDPRVTAVQPVSCVGAGDEREVVYREIFRTA